MNNATASRFCVRCLKELTDAASMEAGIGPICRNLDNALLARLIPSNLPAARLFVDAIDLTSVAPETLSTLNEVCAALLADDAAAREDWRVEVKRIEWALSFPANNFLRADLTKLVAALGYVGLAALWNGDAATGKATITCMNGRIVVQGPNKAAARKTFRNIKGSKFHPANALITKACWSFPGTAHETVFNAVITHYPNHDGLSEALEAAKKAIPAPVAVVAAPVEKAAPKCCLTPMGVLLKVATPYNPAFISDLKALPYNDRRWNKTEKVWEVPLARETDVKALVVKHYGQDALQ